MIARVVVVNVAIVVAIVGIFVLAARKWLLGYRAEDAARAAELEVERRESARVSGAGVLLDRAFGPSPE